MVETNNYTQKALKGQLKLEELSQQNQEKDEQLKEPKRGWGHILCDIKYSSGPGDNIYVYG